MPHGHAGWCSSAALPFCNRLDIALLVGPVLALVIFGRPTSMVGLLPVALWLLAAAWYYGTTLPNTMYDQGRGVQYR